jgi:hypothetical protein
MMVSPVVAQMMADQGWTKQSVREFLWANSKIPSEQLRRAGAPAWFEIHTSPATRESVRLDPWPISSKPENLIFVVAGGAHPTHAQWLQASSRLVIGRVVRVPETFDQLLTEADRDLGCGDDVCRI